MELVNISVFLGQFDSKIQHKPNEMTRVFLFFAIVISTFFTSVLAQSKIEEYFYNGDYETALKLLNDKIAARNASANDFNLAANCNLQDYKYEAAIQNYQTGLTQFPDNILLVEGLADAQLNLGYKSQALQGYNRLVKNDPENTRFLGKQAGVLMDLDRYLMAKDIYQKLFDADSTNIYFLRKLMMAKYKLQQFAYVVDLKIKNRYFPYDNKELQLIVADCYAKVNYVGDAVALLDSILTIDSLYIPAISKLAIIQFGNYKNYSDAVVLYRRLNELEGNSDLMHIRNLAICEYFVGNQEVSGPLLEALMHEVESNDPFIPFYAGLSYKKLGDEDKALEYLQKAELMLIPSYAGDIMHHLGRAYAAKRMLKEAIAAYQKVIEYEPENYHVLYDLATSYDELSMNSTVALEYYRQYLAKCSNRRSNNVKYAEHRVGALKEELFFEGK